MKPGIRVIRAVILLTGLLLAVPPSADTNHPPVKQTRPTKPWHVTGLTGEPWANHFVAGYKCAQNKYSCTAERCQAEIWGCSTRLSGTWARVTADVGARISGMRVGTFWKPPSCH